MPKTARQRFRAADFDDGALDAVLASYFTVPTKLFYDEGVQNAKLRVHGSMKHKVHSTKLRALLENLSPRPSW